MTRRIAMWSGPRNISTTMMRSFENRPDCAVIDEPFYAHYLTVTGLEHPMRQEILASQPRDWQEVVCTLTTANPAKVHFQKHMCHHLTPEIDRTWLTELDHFFLIREPARMVASYADRMEAVTVQDLGLEEERMLYDYIADLTGRQPAIVDAHDILADPRAMLKSLCARLEIPFSDSMLAWPAGKRESDGVWAPHWYRSVETSTGFRPPDEREPDLADHLQEIVDACLPHFHYLHEQRLTAH